MFFNRIATCISSRQERLKQATNLMYWQSHCSPKKKVRASSRSRENSSTFSKPLPQLPSLISPTNSCSNRPPRFSLSVTQPDSLHDYNVLRSYRLARIFDRRFQQSSAHNCSSYDNYARGDHRNYANLVIVSFASRPTIQY